MTVEYELRLVPLDLSQTLASFGYNSADVSQNLGILELSKQLFSFVPKHRQ